MTTRVCVKNLHKGCSEKALQQHFAKCGPFTDVKIMRTRDGVSRGFGFIGFESEAAAQEAVRYFDKTFIGMRRIAVEVAKKVGDVTLARPWSRYSKGSSSYQTLHPQEGNAAKKRKTVATEDDPELREFLDLMMPKRRLAKWEDPDVETEQTADPGADVTADAAEASDVGRRLFVRNLAYAVKESDLVEAFAPFGDLTEVHVVLDKERQNSKGFAFVEYDDATAAAQALAKMDRSIFRGRILHVLPSQVKPQAKEPPKTAPSVGLSSFKREREAELKEKAGNRMTWNTFYIRSDTVTEAVADLYGMSVSDLMDRDASDLGVRLALGETQVLAKTKEDLEAAGVDVSQLEAAAKASGHSAVQTSLSRCDRTLVVKNLPYNASETELKTLFESHGTIERFVMPGTRVMAIVQFRKPAEAKLAFRQLVYKKYKTVPLYLEWAPLHTLTAPPTHASDGGVESEGLGVALYVKNLAFATKDEGLRRHFDAVASEVGGELRSARVVRRKHANGTIVSAGFGFVEVNSETVAKHVLHKLQHSVLDGHVLQIRWSVRQEAVAPRGDKEQDELGASKLVVKNLAFECSRQDLVSLFSPFGHVQSCRLPKKFDGSHRGFAFLQFVTRDDAQTAMDRVQGTHLYGRRLTIQFAKEESS